MGYLVGPVVGSLLNSVGGYLLPFIFFGSLSLLLIPPMICMFKKSQLNIISTVDKKLKDGLVNSGVESKSTLDDNLITLIVFMTKF